MDADDGKPYDMSQFTLGERYGSEDMYREMGIVPGSRVAFEKDGFVYTDTVQMVSYSSSPEWAPPIEPTGWRRVVRWLTPPRFRKPLPRPPRGAGTVTVTVGETGETRSDVRQRYAYERALEALRQSGVIVDGLINPGSGV